MTAAREGEAEKPLTDAERKRILREVAEVQATEDLSDAAVSRIIGCSRSTWSQVKNRKYRGSADDYLRRLRFWLEDREFRRSAPETDYVETSIGRQIMAICRRAAEMPTIGLVVTPSGCGKTVALTEYVRRRAENVVFIQAGEPAATKHALLAEIAAGVGLGLPMRSNFHRTWLEVRRRLAGHYAGGRGQPTLIVIDEATTLRPAALNLLRNLHDDPRCRPGIVLADTWRLDEELHSSRGLAGGYEQLRSRGGAQLRWPAKQAISQADVEQVADAVLAALGHKRRLTQSAYRYLTKIAQREGRLRNVVHRLWAVHDVGREGAAYSLAQLDYVADLVGHDQEIDTNEVPFEHRRAG